MKKNAVWMAVMLGLLFPCWAAADDPAARGIMEKVDARDDGDNQSSQMEMILIDKHGKERRRLMKAFRKDKGEDKLSIMFFIEPADVRDTGFLTWDYDDANRDDDQWLYLPELKKTKRIASSDKSGSFMGSDFSYADMTSRDLENYDYKLLKEAAVDGHAVWVIESLPRSAEIVERYGYTKSVVFVRQDNYVVVRGINWVKEGDKLKYMDVKQLEKIDGIWVPLEVHMFTKKSNVTLHKTVLKYKDVRFNQDLKEDFFTVRQLEKGY